MMITRTPASSRPTPEDRHLESRLAAWTAAELISAEQARRLREAERDARVAGRPERSSLVPEALGYVGGVVVVVGAALLADQLWTDLATSWRLVLVGASAGGLIVAGAIVPHAGGPAVVRLRAVLWAAAVVLTAVFLAVLTHQAIGLSARQASVATGGGAAVLAVTLWRARPTILQQAAAVAALAVTAASLVVLADADSAAAGLGPWAVGVTWLLLARGRVLGPARVAFSLAAITAVAGSVFSAETDAGTALALVTAGALVLMALRVRDVVLLAIGAAGALLVLPMAVQNWFGGSLAAPVALILCGVGLIGAGVWIARSDRDDRADRRRYDGGDPRFAIAASVVLAVAVAAIVGVAR